MKILYIVIIWNLYILYGSISLILETGIVSNYLIAYFMLAIIPNSLYLWHRDRKAKEINKNKIIDSNV